MEKEVEEVEEQEEVEEVEKETMRDGIRKKG